jgi:hypothetical protein
LFDSTSLMSSLLWFTAAQLYTFRRWRDGKKEKEKGKTRPPPPTNRYLTPIAFLSPGLLYADGWLFSSYLL